MGNFNKKKLKKKLFPFEDKRENTLKNGLRRRQSPSGPFVFVPDTRGLTLMKRKYAPNSQL